MFCSSMSFCSTMGSIVPIGNNLTLLHIHVCLIHKTLLNSHCFTSVSSFQHRLMSLHHNSLILSFQLDFSLALHVQWTTQVENWPFPLISPTGSAYFVEKLNSDWESWIPIGWLGKSDNRIESILCVFLSMFMLCCFLNSHINKLKEWLF